MNSFPHQIRFAKAGESKELLKIQKEALLQNAHTHYEAAEIKAWVSSTSAQDLEDSIAIKEIILCEGDGKILGFGHYQKTWKEIKELYVNPQYLQQGIGRRIAEEIENMARKEGASRLRTFASLNSTEFYQKLGFKIQQETFLDMGKGKLLPFLQMEKAL